MKTFSEQYYQLRWKLAILISGLIISPFVAYHYYVKPPLVVIEEVCIEIPVEVPVEKIVTKYEAVPCTHTSTWHVEDSGSNFVAIGYRAARSSSNVSTTGKDRSKSTVVKTGVVEFDD